jgi:hypothetical protein
MKRHGPVATAASPNPIAGVSSIIGMPLFYFHLRDGAKVIRDPEGVCLPDIAAARAEAVQSARELMSQSIETSARVGLERQFEIANDAGETLAIVSFQEAVD